MFCYKLRELFLLCTLCQTVLILHVTYSPKAIPIHFSDYIISIFCI